LIVDADIPTPTIGHEHNLLRARSGTLLSSDKVEHLPGRHLGRLLAHHSEERLQIMRYTRTVAGRARA
jgi:hypothetical protein